MEAAAAINTELPAKHTAAEQAFLELTQNLDQQHHALFRFMLGVIRYNCYDAGYRAGMEFALSKRPIPNDIRLAPNYGPEDVNAFVDRPGISLAKKE